jgi:hypothetical protein
MTMTGRRQGRSAQRLLTAAIAVLGADRAAARLVAVEALPRKRWKGRMLYRVRCNGTSGQGPHHVYLPLAAVWQLIDLQHFYCTHHQGDPWGRG